MASENFATQETAFGFGCLEQPVLGATGPAGWLQLRGWLVPKRGHHFSDVRARCEDCLFPAVHGYPHPDLAGRFPFAPAPLLAGFQVAVNLHAGSNHIRIEALAGTGDWQPFLDVRLVATATTGPTAGEPSPEPLAWHEFTRALDLLLRRQGARPDAPLETLANEVADMVAFRRRLLAPPPGFHAHWDEPAALTPVRHGRIALGGFLFHESGPLRRLLATTDLLLWQTVELGRARPDVSRHFPQHAHAAHSGAFALIDAPAQLPSPLTLRLYAELADGSLHLCGAQRTRVITPAEARRRYPARDSADLDSADLDRSRLALEKACQQSGLAWHDSPELSRAVAQLAAEFPAAHAASAGPALTVPVASTHPVPRAITLCTHNLNLEGAPLFLLDLARALAAGGAQLTVLSPADGPLRGRFEALGATVAVLDLVPLWSAPSEAVARDFFQPLAVRSEFANAGLVIANTFASFWGVHAAKTARRPALFYIHESVTPAHFYREHQPAHLIALVEEAFALADCVSFTTAATRDCHLPASRMKNPRLTPGWIDLAALDRWAGTHSRAECRRQLGVRDTDLLVSNIGTVSDRKGQHVFVRAVELLCRAHPELAARARFIMVGGRDTIFDRQLADLLEHGARANLTVVPETAGYLTYFHAADLFVCSSFEESSPRVVLEAMALGTPIVSSGVDGVPEQVRHEIEAELVPPGDTAALASAMAKLLRSPETGQAHAARARTRVVEMFNAEILLPRHVALACAVAAGQF